MSPGLTRHLILHNVDASMLPASLTQAKSHQPATAAHTSHSSAMHSLHLTLKHAIAKTPQLLMEESDHGNGAVTVFARTTMSVKILISLTLTTAVITLLQVDSSAAFRRITTISNSLYSPAIQLLKGRIAPAQLIPLQETAAALDKIQELLETSDMEMIIASATPLQLTKLQLLANAV
jgi:hypothetical protein